MRADSAHERWEGFWCIADEGYYARCLRSDGSEQWYRFADEVPRKVVKVVAETRVLRLRPRARDDGRRMLLLGSRNGRAILVGTSRRRSRAQPRGAGGAR